MDTAIGLSGDIELDENGLPYFIEGNDELIQKIYILLSAKEGRFPYDRELGSCIGNIDISSADAAVLIEAEARKALGQLDGVEVSGAEVRNGRVFVFVTADNGEFEIEVRRNVDG